MRVSDKTAVEHLNTIIMHLRTSQIQRAPSDDKVIAGHIDDALHTARMLRRLVQNTDNREAA